MNSIYKKDVEYILVHVAKEMNVSYEQLLNSWKRCSLTYLDTVLGIPIKCTNQQIKNVPCDFEGCSKKVRNPKPIGTENKIYCSLHLHRLIEKSKKSVGRCTYAGVAGKSTCPSKVVYNTKFCKRHQPTSCELFETHHVHQD